MTYYRMKVVFIVNKIWLLTNLHLPLWSKQQAMEFKHPEIQDSEIFLLNVKDSEDWGIPPFCDSVRRGNVAYTTVGDVVPDMKPLFGKLKPLEEIRLKKVAQLNQLITALVHLEEGKLLDLNEHSITADNGELIYGFMRHEGELYVQTPNHEYPIEEIADDVLQFIIEEELDDVGTILEHIENKHYQTNSL